MRIQARHIFQFLFLLLLHGCSLGNSKTQEFESFKVQRKDLLRYVEANGSIDTEKRFNVYPPVSGQLDQLFVQEGDKVQEGQKLASMSSNTRITFMDIAKSKGKSEAKYWEKQILPIDIFAPSSGTILSIHGDIGSRIGGTLMVLVSGTMAKAVVDEMDLPQISLGQPVRVYFDVMGEKYIRGKISKIAQNSRTVNNVNTYAIEVTWPQETVDKLNFEVRTGMSVTLHIEIEQKKNALALPVRAVGGKSAGIIDVFDQQGRPIQIEIGDTYGDFVEVKSGAAENDVIKTPAFKVARKKNRKTPLLFDK